MHLTTRVLTNDEWQKITSAINFPVEARQFIDRTLILFRRDQLRGSISASKKRSQYTDLEENCGKLLTFLNIADADTIIELFCEIPDSEECDEANVDIGFYRAKNLFQEIDCFYKKLQQAKANIPHKIGTKDDKLLNLIQGLDDILYKFTGQHISRSYKKAEYTKYIELAVHLADLKIKKSVIDRAMKLHIKTVGIIRPKKRRE